MASGLWKMEQMLWKRRLAIAGGRLWVLIYLGSVELARLFTTQLIRCWPQGGEEWALALSDLGNHCVRPTLSGSSLGASGGILLGIPVMVSWPWLLIFNPKGASGLATSFCGF